METEKGNKPTETPTTEVDFPRGLVATGSAAVRRYLRMLQLFFARIGFEAYQTWSISEVERANVRANERMNSSLSEVRPFGQRMVKH
jgi:hypothetical protein